MTRARLLESVAFGALALLAVGALLWRQSQLGAGLAADQGESLALARALAQGLELRWTAASSPVGGPPNLVWLLAQAGVLRAGLTPEVWLPRLASALLMGALLLVALRGAWLWRRAPRVEDALPALGLALATALAEAGALGSGAAAWVFASTAVTLIVGRGLGSAHTVSTGVAIGLLCLLRPSAVWLLVGSAPAWWLAARVEGRQAWRETAAFLGAGLFVAGFVLAGRFVLLGALPLEGLLPAQDGVAQTAEFLTRQSRWWWGALGAVLVAAVWRRFHLRGGATLVAWIVMTLVLASWTQQPRTLFLGCTPLMAMLIGDGLSSARDGARGEEVALRRLSWLALAALSLMLALAVRASFTLGPIMAVAAPIVPRGELQAEFGRRGLRQPFVAWTDGAEAAALFPSARVVVARAWSDGLGDLLTSEGPPDLVDRRLAIGGELRAGLTEGVGGEWWLAAQSPDDDPRCPEGRLALLSLTPGQLLDQLEQDLGGERFQRALSRWRCALAALDDAHLPPRAERERVVAIAANWAVTLERQGRLELAVRAAALAASLSGEELEARARAERLRARWLVERPSSR